LVKAGRLFSYVVTLCDEAAAEQCPFYPDIAQRLHGSFPSPSRFGGSEEEKLAEVRKIRDSIRKKIEDWGSTIKKLEIIFSRNLCQPAWLHQTIKEPEGGNMAELLVFHSGNPS